MDHSPGLKVNFSVHLQSFVHKIFPLANVQDRQQILSKCLRDMDDSYSQAFAGGYFSYLQIIKITQTLISSSYSHNKNIDQGNAIPTN